MLFKPVLKQPNYNKPFIIKTNVSEQAIGCVLLQKEKDDKLHPVAFNKQKLLKAKLNYLIYKKKLLSIKKAL